MPRRTSGSLARRSIATNARQQQRGAAPAPASVGASVDVRRADDGEHEQDHRRGDRQRAGEVEAALQARVVVARHDAVRDDQQQRGHHDRREEHPAPADRGQQAADDHAEAEARRGHARVDQQRPVALAPLREAGRDDREPGRGHEARRDAGDEARDDHQPALARDPAEAGEDDEDRHPQQEHPASPEQVGGTTAEQHEAAVAEHVRAHDPLQLARGHAELGADRGQRDAHHRDVDALHEDGAAEDEQQRQSGSGHWLPFTVTSCK